MKESHKKILIIILKIILYAIGLIIAGLSTPDAVTLLINIFK